MTFFYDLNKRLASITSQPTKQVVTEGAKPDYIDLDKDGNRKEPMKQAARQAKEVDEGSTGDYSAKKARAGKDIGKPGKQFAKIAKGATERYGSKERGEKVAGAVLAKLRAKEDVAQEGNKFTGNLAKARAAGKKQADLDGDGDMERVLEKKEKVLWPGTPEYEKKFPKDMRTGEKKRSSTGGEIEKTATGVRHTAKAHDDEEETKADDGAPKRRGRPKGSKKAMGAKFTGKSKLLQKSAIREEGDEEIAIVDKGEYDQEGDMAQDQLHTAADAAKELHDILSSDENLPEWVQSKITKAMDYLDSARDYMSSKKAGEQEPVAEKAVSKAQQRFMGMVHAAQKGEKPASKEVAKVAKEMPKKAAKDFAKTKHAGLPEKVKAKKDESVEETKEESTKSSGGFQFGKGIYDSINRDVERLISESMNVSMNMSNDPEGGPNKSLTVSATDEDAIYLGKLLKMAGLGSGSGGCGCGTDPCSCEQMDEAYGDTEATENSADWPTNTETSDDALQYSGGLNKPKTTVAGDGQTTVPVTAVRVKEEAEEDLDEGATEELEETAEDVEESIARLRGLAGIQETAKIDVVESDTKSDPAADARVQESALNLSRLWQAYKVNS